MKLNPTFSSGSRNKLNDLAKNTQSGTSKQVLIWHDCMYVDCPLPGTLSQVCNTSIDLMHNKHTVDLEEPSKTFEVMTPLTLGLLPVMSSRNPMHLWRQWLWSSYATRACWKRYESDELATQQGSNSRSLLEGKLETLHSLELHTPMDAGPWLPRTSLYFSYLLTISRTFNGW